MAQVKIYLDPIGNTINIWWDYPAKSAYSDEAENWTVIPKDKNGVPLGLEIIGAFPKELDPLQYLPGPANFQLENYDIIPLPWEKT